MEAKASVDVLVRRRLRELRMQRGLTLEDVAQAARIDVSTLSRLESGKRRLALDHLPRLAAALSVSTDDLVREPAAEDPRVRGSSQTRHGVTYFGHSLGRAPLAGCIRSRSGSVPAVASRPPSYPCMKVRNGSMCCQVGCDLSSVTAISPSIPVKPWSSRHGCRTGSA